MGGGGGGGGGVGRGILKKVGFHLHPNNVFVFMHLYLFQFIINI